MAHVDVGSDIEIDELICPITLEVFRDPVIAGDGRIYEREAITRWILEHGTSPFTRQPLEINELQPDDRLRRLGRRRRRRKSTVSYNTQNESITLPPLRRVPKHKERITPLPNPPQAEPTDPPNEIRTSPPLRGIRRVAPQIPVNETGRQPEKKSSIKICLPEVGVPAACFCFILLFTVIMIIVMFTLPNICTQFHEDSLSTYIYSTYSSSFTERSPIFPRPDRNSTRYCYEAFWVHVTINGTYEFRGCAFIGVSSYLYFPYFNATDSYNGLLATGQDTDRTSLPFVLRLSLTNNFYILVVTTFVSLVGSKFTVHVAGPGEVTFNQLQQ